MRIEWSHFVIPVGAAAIAAVWIPVSFWDQAKPSLLTALSVIAAGTLVRLARGLPFTNSDQFELEEARRLAAAIKQSVRSLRALIVVIFVGMGILILARTIETNIVDIAVDKPDFTALAGRLISAMVALPLVYSFVRVFAVVGGDVGLVDLQAQYFERAVQRKQADRFDKRVAAAPEQKMSRPEGYGRLIQ